MTSRRTAIEEGGGGAVGREGDGAATRRRADRLDGEDRVVRLGAWVVVMNIDALLCCPLKHGWWWWRWESEMGSHVE